MAKSIRPKINVPNPPPVRDRTTFWSDLQYLPIELKNEVWAAQNLYFMKKNGRTFLDPKRAKEYFDTDLLKLNEGVYKQMFDPITPMNDGGTAKYVNADWKANPIYIHLKNVVKAEIQRTSKQIEVNLKDKFAKTRKMRDSYRILYSRLFRELINEYAPLAGLPPISESQDPYKWIKKLSEDTSGENKNEEGKPQGGGDVITKYEDLIKNQITDSQDMALYNELIYKGDYEQAFEKGIQHYMFDLNKWSDRWGDFFADYIIHFNKASGEWYTDLVTGRPVIEGYQSEYLVTSPFKKKDGEDIMYYYTEYNITFADFVKTIGVGLTPEKLKDVFEYNKSQGSVHGNNWIEWGARDTKLRDDSMIRVGRASVLTQNYDVFMDGIAPGYPNYSQVPLSWKPEKNTPNKYKTRRDEKHYNVWYSWYYIPPTQSMVDNSDYGWQAQFIFQIKKNQDQFRYGEDGRYSKSPLVIYDNSRQASFTDITQYWMPKIHWATMQYQNCLLNDIDATILSDEFLGGLVAAVDEDNNMDNKDPNFPTGGNGIDAMNEQWKMIKQRGTGFLKFTDKQGKPLADPSKLVVHFKNGQLERASHYLEQVAIMYNQLVQALAVTDQRDIKPRVPVAGLEEAMKTSDNAIWFVQKSYEAFIKQYAERFIQYILMVVKEPQDYGYFKRFDEFKDVIGLANGLLIEGMEDIPPESVGLTINYTDNSAKKDLVVQLALKYIDQGKLDDDMLYLIMGTDNWKTSMCLMRMGIKARKKEQAAKEELQQKYIMQQKQADLQIAQALNAAKGQAKDQNIMTQGKVQMMVDEAMNKNKAGTMAQQKDQISNNKQKENAQKAQLQRQNETADALEPETTEQ